MVTYKQTKGVIMKCDICSKEKPEVKTYPFKMYNTETKDYDDLDLGVCDECFKEKRNKKMMSYVFYMLFCPVMFILAFVLRENFIEWDEILGELAFWVLVIFMPVVFVGFIYQLIKLFKKEIDISELHEEIEEAFIESMKKERGADFSTHLISHKTYGIRKQSQSVP